MGKARYDIRIEEDGTWTVFDLVTGLPAEVNDVPQDHMDFGRADDLADLLNHLHVSKSKKTCH